MPPVDRNNPRRARASESRYSVMEFLAEFPDDAACLDYLWRTLYASDGKHYTCPKCKVLRTFHRVESRPLYSCAKCGKGIHPTARTIFEKSSTSLHLWFYGIYLMASTRCGISAKQLERELGVTYKTAWRMFNKIRSLLGQDEDEAFSGIVEMDEAFVGGKAKWRSKQRNAAKGVRDARGDPNKTPLMGMAQRGTNGKHGKVAVQIVPDSSARSLLPHAQARVLPGTMIHTDEWSPYDGLSRMGFNHSRVQHGQKVYVSGDVHTNTIEGFWSLLKRGIGGVYHSVSTKHLQSYCDEYVFRYNNRDREGRGMFDAFMERVERESLPRLPAPASTPSEVRR